MIYSNSGYKVTGVWRDWLFIRISQCRATRLWWIIVIWAYITWVTHKIRWIMKTMRILWSSWVWIWVKIYVRNKYMSLCIITSLVDVLFWLVIWSLNALNPRDWFTPRLDLCKRIFTNTTILWINNVSIHVSSVGDHILSAYYVLIFVLIYGVIFPQSLSRK